MPSIEIKRGEIRFQRATGPAAAAFTSAMLGLLALTIVNLGTEISQPFRDAVFGIGKLWMPGAQGIGPYSGKETIMLVVWLGSWAGLHIVLRKKDVDLVRWGIVFLLGLGLATTFIWPPTIDLILR